LIDYLLTFGAAL